MTKLVGIAGSLRSHSLNRGLLRAAAELMPQGAKLSVHGIEGIPLYNADDERASGLPEAVTILKEAIASADGLLLVTPEYNNGIPGVFKNAIDWLSRPADDIQAEFRASGGQGLGYGSIVAAGRNAASLHYTGGEGPINAGEMILIDAGASVGGYASDITRTFPASGVFTPKQRADYDLVLEAQNAAVHKLKAGVHYRDLSEAAKDVFRRAGRIDEFTHGLGHFVGLHVHDAGDTSQPLPAGAVLTIEPGLYLQSENYGIRIEDMYHVIPTGAEHLSAGIPRTAIEIEQFMAAGRT